MSREGEGEGEGGREGVMCAWDLSETEGRKGRLMICEIWEF